MQSTARLLTPPVLSPPLSALPEVSLLTIAKLSLLHLSPHITTLSPQCVLCIVNFGIFGMDD